MAEEALLTAAENEEQKALDMAFLRLGKDDDPFLTVRILAVLRTMLGR